MEKDELVAEVRRLRECMTRWADYFEMEAKNEHGTFMNSIDWKEMANDMRLDRDNLG